MPSASTGRPVLALMDASQIPAIPESQQALRGQLAAMAVVCDVAAHPDDMARRWAFDTAVDEARKHPSYDYSRAFLDAADAAMHELADVMDAETAENLAAIRGASHVIELTATEPDGGR